MIDYSKNNYKTIFKIIIAAALMLLAVLNYREALDLVLKIYGIVYPLLLGAVIAFVLNILVVKYEKIYFPKSKNKFVVSSRRTVSVLLAIMTIILVVFFALRIVIPQLVKFITLLVEKFPGVYDSVVKWIFENSHEFPALQQKIKELNMDGYAVLNKVLGLLGNWTFGTVTFIGSAFGAVVEFILAVTFSVYILAGKEDLKNKFKKLFKAYINKEKRTKLYDVLTTANDSFSSYIVGQCKEAVILGTLCTAGMIILGFPYSTIIGPVMGLTALIPMIGAYIGAALGFLLIVAVNPLKALLFVIFIVVLQQVEGNLIYPKVVGNSIGLPGIWVFAAVIIGGGLMGIAGILLGVPFAATVYKLISKSVNERIKKAK
ncbi:MAG: hypothetical protein K0Q47_776 [Sedimentibacter sp.]|jgi:predicted PurR-regulated permease PerM|nr:hypothetical protein [Sedimentibacter sp.]